MHTHMHASLRIMILQCVVVVIVLVAAQSVAAQSPATTQIVEKHPAQHRFLEWVKDIDGEWTLRRVPFCPTSLSFLQSGATQVPPPPAGGGAEERPDHAVCTCRLELLSGASTVNDLVDATAPKKQGFRQQEPPKISRSSEEEDGRYGLHLLSPYPGGPPSSSLSPVYPHVFFYGVSQPPPPNMLTPATTVPQWMMPSPVFVSGWPPPPTPI